MSLYSSYSVDDAKKTLRVAFSTLDDEQKANIRFHLENKTPILCGADAEWYVDGKGGG